MPLRGWTQGAIVMKRKSMLIDVTATVSLAVLATGAAISADKYSVKVPNGLAFSEFKGYESWRPFPSARTGG
jgi:hypothetical protein